MRCVPPSPRRIVPTLAHSDYPDIGRTTYVDSRSGGKSGLGAGVRSRPAVVAAVVEVAVEGEATRVTVDLADVDFVDSSGLATFIKAHRLLEVRGARLTVAGAQPHVRRMFPITGIDQVVRLVDAPPGQVG